MKISPYVTKLNSSDVFKDFQKGNKDAFAIAGFFVLDLESGHNVHQIDYYVPSKKKVAAFTLDKHVTIQMLDLLNNKQPEKLELKTTTDLDQLPGILEDEMKNRNITEEIKKIIAIIQNIDGKRIWNLSCVLSGMTILNAHVEDESKSVIKMEKKSLLDFMQKVNPQQLKSGKGIVDPKKAGKSAAIQKDVDAQIKKLDELAQAIEKEKDALKAEKSGKKSEKMSKSSK